jgi:type I restriction enzyme S subunit
VPVATNQGFQSLIPKPGVHSWWLYYAVSSMRPQLERLAAGSTFRELSRKALRAVLLPVPPPDEQLAIAHALDAVDQAIEKTEAVIEASGRVRTGLLQELLTRGAPGYHTAWKDEPTVGTMPTCWEVVRLGDIAELKYGTSARCDYQPNGLPVLRIPNVATGSVDTNDLKYASLTSREASALVLRDGDLLAVRTNGNPDICGTFALFGLPGDWIFASYLIRVRILSEIILPDFALAYLGSPSARRQLRRRIRTSAGNYNISAGGLKSVSIPVPPLEEQRLIVSTLVSGEQRTRRERAVLSALMSLKGSAADDLLTGRVRLPGGLGG